MNWRIFRATIVMCVIVPASMFLLPLLAQPIHGPVDARGVLEVESTSTPEETAIEFVSAAVNGDLPIPFLAVVPGQMYEQGRCVEYVAQLTVTVSGQQYVSPVDIMLCQESGAIAWPYRIGVLSNWRVPKEVTGLAADFFVAASGNMRVRCPHVPGDMDGDGDADLADFSVFGRCFGLGGYDYAHATCGDPVTFACADVTGDGKVDLNDFFVFAQAVR